MIWIILVTVALAVLFLIAMYFNFRELALPAKAAEREPLSEPLTQAQLDALITLLSQHLDDYRALRDQDNQQTTVTQQSEATKYPSESEDNIISFHKNNRIEEDVRNVG